MSDFWFYFLVVVGIVLFFGLIICLSIYTSSPSDTSATLKESREAQQQSQQQSSTPANPAGIVVALMSGL